ncbi:MAG: DNA translocase FtsK 4TM domain-containing protein, partial [Pirellulaceae bacterium]|nr:DNA translocase FtsK 4TM domain-containing protein [Pirellulaceae bacterium]
MFENRSLKLDLVALGLFAFVIFAGLALATYDVADPVSHLIRPLDRLYQPDAIVFPPNQEVANLCGRWGALAADLMFNALGIGAYYLVLSLAILDVQLLRRRTIDMPIVRGVGWLATLLGLTVIFSLLAPTFSPGPVVGSGGYLGALGASLLQTYFATVGGVILIVSLILGGMLLCTDYTFFRVTRFVMMAAMAGLLSGHRRVRRRRSDVDDFEDEIFSDSEDELAVRIRGRKVGSEQGVGLEPNQSILADTKDEIENVEDPDEEFEDEEFEDEEFEAAELEGGQFEEEFEGEDTSESSELVLAGSEKQLRKDAAEESESLRIRRPQKQEEKSERDEVIDRLNEADRFDDPMDYELPDLDLLIEADDVCFESQAKEVRRKAKILERTFADFGFKVKVVEIETGPVIAQYEVQLEAGLRLSKITGLADDLAIALRVPSVRIVAPIPGKNTVGIEVPNEERQVVRLREVIEEANGRTKKMRIPIFLGKDVSGKPLVVDLSTLPHLLIAGRTGTGKSVCLNAIISSILMSRRPDEVRMLMIDPKMVELCGYGRLPHLMHPVVTDMKKAEAILAWAVDKMEERYSLLAQAGVRHVSSYNQLGREELIERMQPESEEQTEAIPDQLPFIV